MLYEVITVIDWTVARRASIVVAFLMVQKEMAERLASSPGSKAWCPMAIFTQLHFDVDICVRIDPSYNFV